jgi:hypothetical protein
MSHQPSAIAAYGGSHQPSAISHRLEPLGTLSNKEAS